MKIFTSKAQKVGKKGEDVAKKFLMKHGFSILDTNYTKKWGELDIIAQKEEKLYFIEVKSASVSFGVSGETSTPSNPSDNAEQNDFDPRSETQNFFRPEENMHPWKRRRIRRTIETYLISKRIGNTPWQFDVLLVYLDMKQRKAKVKTVENIIL